MARRFDREALMGAEPIPPRRRWGKAGQRLDLDERDRQRIRAKANRARQFTQADNERAWQEWRDGLACPNRITTALNMRDLYGPEVDEACLAREPEVEQWEAGERYPMWPQLLALAELTGFTARFFTTNDVVPVPIWQTSLWFHMSKAEQHAYEREPPPVMRFPRAVLDARPPSPEEMPPGC